MMTMIQTTNLFLVLTAAGSSSRMKAGKKKEYLSLNGGTVLSESAAIFLQNAQFSCVIITFPKGGRTEAEDALFANSKIKNLLGKTQVEFVEGSSTRQASVFNALKKIDEICTNKNVKENSLVLIHDAARPFVSKKIILNVISAAQKYGAAVPAIPPVDTQKEISSDRTIKHHLVRKDLVCVQTPQAFTFNEIFECHKKSLSLKKEFTDDTEIWDSFPEITKGKKVFIVDGESENIKITYPKDLELLKNCEEKKLNLSAIRIGFGTDIHVLAEGRKFLLGGVEIPCEKGELGHSDADVLLHAISDSLLGAAALGDIGSYFPPDDPKWKDADSKILLKKIWNDVKNEGWILNNLDCVVETEIPKILPWRQKIISSIANILEVNENQIFVKGKTNEKLDSIGNKNAIKAYCTCLLTKKSL